MMMEESAYSDAKGVELLGNRHAALLHALTDIKRTGRRNVVSSNWFGSRFESGSLVWDNSKSPSRRFRGMGRRRLQQRARPAYSGIVPGDYRLLGRLLPTFVGPQCKEVFIIVILTLRESLESQVQKLARRFVDVQEMINATILGKKSKTETVAKIGSLKEQFSNELLHQITPPPSTFGNAYLALWFKPNGFHTPSSDEGLLTGILKLKATADQKMREQVKLITECVFAAEGEIFQHPNWFLFRLTMALGGKVRLMPASMLQDISLDEALNRVAMKKRQRLGQLSPNFGADPVQFAICACWLHPACPLALMNDKAAAEVVRRLVTAYGLQADEAGDPGNALRCHRRRMKLVWDHPRGISHLRWQNKEAHDDLRISEFFMARSAERDGQRQMKFASA
jgi:hypothetical protein